MSNKIILCGIDTSTLPSYTSDEMAEMMLEIKNGNEHLKTKFIFGNLRLVLSIIHRFTNRYNNIEDLFQVGCVGLIKSVDNFDVSLNLKFSTYAVPMIIGEIRRFLRDNSSIRVSRSMRDLAYKALQTREKFIRENHCDPDIDFVAKEIDAPYEQVVCALDAISEPISLFDPLYNDDNDTISVIDQVCEQSNSSDLNGEYLIIKDALQKLPIKEREIINMRYFMGKTQVEISNEVGISQAQVSRLEKNALRALKESI